MAPMTAYTALIGTISTQSEDRRRSAKNAQTLNDGDLSRSAYSNQKMKVVSGCRTTTPRIAPRSSSMRSCLQRSVIMNVWLLNAGIVGTFRVRCA